MINRKLKAGGILFLGSAILATSSLIYSPKKVIAEETCNYTYKYYFAETEVVGAVNAGVTDTNGDGIIDQNECSAMSAGAGFTDYVWVSTSTGGYCWNYVANEWINDTTSGGEAKLYKNNFSSMYSTVFTNGALPGGSTSQSVKQYAWLEGGTNSIPSTGLVTSVDLDTDTKRKDEFDNWFKLIRNAEKSNNYETRNGNNITKIWYHGTWANLDSGYIFETEEAICTQKPDGTIDCKFSGGSNDPVTFGDLIRVLDASDYDKFKEDFYNAIVPLKGISIIEHKRNDNKAGWNIQRMYGIANSGNTEREQIITKSLDGQKWKEIAKEYICGTGSKATTGSCLTNAQYKELVDGASGNSGEAAYRWIYMPAVVEEKFTAPCPTSTSNPGGNTGSSTGNNGVSEEKKEEQVKSGIPSYGYLAIVLAGAAGVYVVAKKRNKFIKF